MSETRDFWERIRRVADPTDVAEGFWVFSDNGVKSCRLATVESGKSYLCFVPVAPDLTRDQLRGLMDKFAREADALLSEGVKIRFVFAEAPSHLARLLSSESAMSAGLKVD